MLKRLKRVLPLLLIPIGLVIGWLLIYNQPSNSSITMDATMSTLCAEFNAGRYSESYTEAGVPNTALLLPGETLRFNAAGDLTLLVGHEREIRLTGRDSLSYTVTADRPQGPMLWSADERSAWTVDCVPMGAVAQDSDLLTLAGVPAALNRGDFNALTVNFNNASDETLSDVSVQCRVLAGDLVFIDPVVTNGAVPNAATTDVTVQLGIRPALLAGQSLSSVITIKAETTGSVQCLLYSGDTPLASDIAEYTVRG